MLPPSKNVVNPHVENNCEIAKEQRNEKILSRLPSSLSHSQKLRCIKLSAFQIKGDEAKRTLKKF